MKDLGPAAPPRLVPLTDSLQAARALLQRAPLTVMDESFAALDPATLALCLRCTMDRADALVVIAHP